MKSKIIILLAICIFSCDVLIHNPQDSVTPDDAFSSEASVRNVMVGVYDKLLSSDYYGGAFQHLTDNYADISMYNGFFSEYQEADSKNLPTTNTLVERVWLGIYSVVNITNELVYNIPNVVDDNFTDEEKNELIAEAKAIRALCYLDLLVYFGEHWNLNSSLGIPLFENATNSNFANVENIARSSVEETYQFILSDLNEAFETGVSNSANAYINNSFINALLSRTYLHMQDFTNSLLYSNNILSDTSSTFMLMDNYSDVFYNNSTSESILELTSNSMDPTELSLYTISRSEVIPEIELINSFDSLDTRRALIGTVDGLDGIERLLKYDDYSSHGNPAYLIRLAEIYLYRAEANYFLGNLDGALADLNILRQRAGLSSYENTENLITNYINENRWELFGEGKRLSTLTRIGEAQEILGIADYQRIFPIPAREFAIEGNLLVQNLGY